MQTGFAAVNAATIGQHDVPEISRFLGIVIGMFFNEHGVAHFHAVYAEYEVTVEVETLTVHGDFPKRALGFVLEWAELHKEELLENWQLARQGQPLKRIAPLE
jgi:hypothetical protein